jgi:hypothetical protein
MQLKPQDFLVALKLVALGNQRWTYVRLANELGLSASEAHACVKRGLQAGLLSHNPSVVIAGLGTSVSALADMHEADTSGIHPLRKKRARGTSSPEENDNPVIPHAHNLAEFALHGAKYAFPRVERGFKVGVPTSHSAPAFAGVFAPDNIAYVWPHPNGTMRGAGVEPLHPSAPYAAMQDPKLYELLALFDALRVGRARERGMALERLQALIDPDAPKLLKEAIRG